LTNTFGFAGFGNHFILQIFPFNLGFLKASKTTLFPLELTIPMASPVPETIGPSCGFTFFNSGLMVGFALLL
jgi:hypothetical protein